LSSLDLLDVRLILTFLTMGAWVSVIAVATERWGGKLGGFLVGIPSTSAFSLLFTGLYASPEAAVNATDVFPVFLSLTCIFLFTFALTARKNFSTGLAISSAVWFMLSMLVVLIYPSNFELSLVVCTVITVIIYIGFRGWLMQRSVGRTKPGFKWPVFLLRFTFGGGVVTIAVLMGQMGIPILSGMFAAFPALTTSTLIAIQMDDRTGGTERSRGITLSMMVSIMLMCVPYSIAVHYLYPSMGLLYGTAIAYATTIAIGILYYFLAEDYLVPPVTSPDLEKRPVPGAAELMTSPSNLSNERTARGKIFDQFISAFSLLFERNK
jgi:hypothetical protein